MWTCVVAVVVVTVVGPVMAACNLCVDGTTYFNSENGGAEVKERSDFSNSEQMDEKGRRPSSGGCAFVGFVPKRYCSQGQSQGRPRGWSPS